MTVIEGPEIPVSGLSMGRGWPTALREGQDVTERVLAEARRSDRRRQRRAHGAGRGGRGGRSRAAPAEDGPARRPSTRAGEAASPPSKVPGADQLALGVELAALLGPDAPRLLAAWREVAARASGLSPSESLALAERQLRDHERLTRREGAAKTLLRTTWWA